MKSLTKIILLTLGLTVGALAQDIIAGPKNVAVGDTVQYSAVDVNLVQAYSPFGGGEETIELNTPMLPEATDSQRGLWTVAPVYDSETDTKLGSVDGFEFVEDPDRNENTRTVTFSKKGVYEIHHKLTTDPIKTIYVEERK